MNNIQEYSEHFVQKGKWQTGKVKLILCIATVLTFIEIFKITLQYIESLKTVCIWNKVLHEMHTTNARYIQGQGGPSTIADLILYSTVVENTIYCYLFFHLFMKRHILIIFTTYSYTSYNM